MPEIPKPETPPTAVAEPPPTEPAAAEPPPAEPAVAEQPPAEAAEADEEDAMKTLPASPEPELAEPVGAALSLVSAAPVAAPMVVDLSCDAPNKSEPCQTRAQVDILRKILTLAREIRTDRVYLRRLQLFHIIRSCASLPAGNMGGRVISSTDRDLRPMGGGPVYPTMWGSGSVRVHGIIAQWEHRDARCVRGVSSA